MIINDNAGFEIDRRLSVFESMEHLITSLEREHRFVKITNRCWPGLRDDITVIAEFDTFDELRKFYPEYYL